MNVLELFLSEGENNIRK